MTSRHATALLLVAVSMLARSTRAEPAPAAPSLSAPVEADSGFTLLGQFESAPAHHVEVDGDRLYYTTGPYLVTTDLSDPGHPVEVARFRSEAPFRSLLVSGGRAYAVDTDYRLSILDLTDPAAPRTLSTLRLRAYAPEMVLHDGLLYLANEWMGLTIVDVRDPQRPAVAGRFGFWFEDDQTPAAFDVALHDTLVFLGASRHGVYVLDVSDPAAPDSLGVLPIASPSGIAVSGERAYVASGGLHVFDLSDPRRPVATGSYETRPEDRFIRLAGERAYVAGPGGLSIFSLAVPAQPALLGTLDLPGWTSDLAVAGTHAYVAALSRGVRTVDASDAVHPVETAAFETGDYVMDVVADGPLAYLASFSAGLQVVDASDPAHPTRLALFDTDGEATAIVRAGDLVVLSCTPSLGRGGIYLIDVRQPAAPVQVGLLADRGDLALDGSLLYVASVNSLHVYDLSTPERPERLGQLQLCEDRLQCAHFVAVRPPLAFVLDFLNGLHVIDVSDPRAPVETAFFPVSPWAVHLAAGEATVYVAGEDSIHVVDVSDPRHPVPVGLVGVGRASAPHLRLAGTDLYVADDWLGLQRYDVTDPRRPVATGHFTASSLMDVAVQGDRAYLASQQHGLLILRAAPRPVAAEPDPAPLPGTSPAALLGAYPNPLASEVRIGYRLAAPGAVALDVYDLLGRRIRSLLRAHQPAGRHQAVWDARDDSGAGVPDGVYAYRLAAAGRTLYGTLVVVR